MSLKKVHEDQPKEFKFSSENLKKAEEICFSYGLTTVDDAGLSKETISS